MKETEKIMNNRSSIPIKKSSKATNESPNKAQSPTTSKPSHVSSHHRHIVQDIYSKLIVRLKINPNHQLSMLMKREDIKREFI